MKFLFLIFLAAVLHTSSAERSKSNGLLIDTSKIEVRHPSESSISKFKNDKDFLYDEAKATNWWDAFRLWIRNLLIKLIGSRAFGFFQKYLTYFIILAAIIIVFLVLRKSKLSGLFYSRIQEHIPPSGEIKEDINEINFDNSISDAVAKKDFRIAVRLYYLKTLKILSDKKHINFNINKTNQNYLNELKNNNLMKPFEDLTYLFEWIWYGNLEVQDILFEKTKNSFVEFHISLLMEK